MGSGWALEPYEGSGSRTLVSYIANVSDNHAWAHHICNGHSTIRLLVCMYIDDESVILIGYATVYESCIHNSSVNV